MAGENEIKISDFREICRTCLSRNKYMKSIFESNINNMLVTCTSIQVCVLPIIINKTAQYLIIRSI